VDGVVLDGVVLYNPQAMTVERYRFRGAQIVRRSTSARSILRGHGFRQTNHDDGEFVGRVSEQLSLAMT
jgi:hypothetical protein